MLGFYSFCGGASESMVKGSYKGVNVFPLGFERICKRMFVGSRYLSSLWLWHARVPL